MLISCYLQVECGKTFWMPRCGYDDQIDILHSVASNASRTLKTYGDKASKNIASEIEELARKIEFYSDHFIYCCDKLDEQFDKYYSKLIKHEKNPAYQSIIENQQQIMYEKFGPIQGIINEFMVKLIYKRNPQQSYEFVRQLYDEIITLMHNGGADCPRPSAFALEINHFLESVKK